MSDIDGVGRRGRKPTEGLTVAQDRALRVLRDLLQSQSFPPTVQELASELGIAGASAHELLKSLERKGYVRRTQGKARTLELLARPDDRATGSIAVPVVGRVAAGMPTLATENVIGEILVEGSVARGHCFALEVQGDSMVDAGIEDGDYVIVRQQPIAESGEIVVALLDGEATIKRLKIVRDLIELRPENQHLSPITVGPEADLRIVGKVIAVRRARSYAGPKTESDG